MLTPRVVPQRLFKDALNGDLMEALKALQEMERVKNLALNDLFSLVERLKLSELRRAELERSFGTMSRPSAALNSLLLEVGSMLELQQLYSVCDAVGKDWLH